MLSDERLNEIGSYLERTSIAKPAEIDALNEVLLALYRLPLYQEWLIDGQFHNMSSPDNRFVIPNDFGIGMVFANKQLLDKYLLINGYQLTVKVDVHRGRIHLTDGNWVPVDRRVFPYADESEALIKFAEERDLFNTVDLLIDPACGCGHHALGTPRQVHKVSMDKKLRAIAYLSYKFDTF